MKILGYDKVDAEVYGTSDDGRYALLLIGEDAYIASVRDGQASGPRWECSRTHLGHYDDVYRPRFPVSS